MSDDQDMLNDEMARARLRRSSLAEIEQALRRSHNDLSDIDPTLLRQAREGQEGAYQLAREIEAGTRDPLGDR
jgi:hypothetical protein